MTTMDPNPRTMQIRTVRVIMAVGFALLIALVLPATFRAKQHHLHLKTCLQEADRLSNGAGVQMFGVNVGSVRQVRVKPVDHECPVSVQMDLRTDYELNVPLDSQAYIGQAGVLGSAFISIDSSRASGNPAPDWATIPSKKVSGPTFQDVLDQLGKTCGEALNKMDQQQLSRTKK